MKYLGIQTQIRRNNQRSALLLILFPVLLVALSWLFFFLLELLVASNSERPDQGVNIDGVNYLFLNALPFVVLACGLWFVIAYFSHTSMINKATSAHSLSRKENMRVYNLVENLCMSQGMTMPKINVIEDDSLNAFASGINEKTYTVTLSRGIINKLNDEELEGVIAHELTHIRNRDVRLLIVSIIFVGIFAFLTEMAMRSVRYGALSGGGNNRNKNNNNIIIILLILVLAAIGYLISMVMRFAISRNREYMADAGAVEMTKRPEALASALRKISGDPRIEAVTREDVAQLFIENALDKKPSFFGKLFATPPPIEERIRVLEAF
ncbi:M48 family metallopeptidase [Parabacteroides sp. Marseille-P3160]|uniref:M48 family metallopeptidase n=1 Tax=Parabacteroides sp. Marseille-P3160 TaxID=1917887 RepID=UPI0009BC6F59|nr:M48 family metallopeptidase [Parabacteroides sp. Marseille-P3160]